MPFGDIETFRGFTSRRRPSEPVPPELPVISALEPDNGLAFDTILIGVLGSRLTPDSHIFFNEIAYTTIFVSVTRIEASIDVGPAGEKTVWVWDTAANGKSNTLIFTVT